MMKMIATIRHCFYFHILLSLSPALLSLTPLFLSSSSTHFTEVWATGRSLAQDQTLTLNVHTHMLGEAHTLRERVHRPHTHKNKKWGHTEEHCSLKSKTQSEEDCVWQHVWALGKRRRHTQSGEIEERERGLIEHSFFFDEQKVALDLRHRKYT